MAGIYIHIPFCKQACNYCDFHFSTTFEVYRSQLIDAICTELIQRKTEFQSNKVGSIYFGGGTPSLLNKKELTKIFSAIHGNFKLKKDIEITLECNPDDVDEQKLKLWKELGINRLSIGVQSFDDEVLGWMNRAHNSKMAVNALRLINEYGFFTTLDLIYGIPNTSLKDWKANILTALKFNPMHISAYCLTIEPKTVLKHQVENNKVKLLDDEEQNKQFEMLINVLKENGYEQYEISNFAKDKNYAVHNSNYWLGEPYLGVGPSAHSFDGAFTRRWNMSNNRKYIKSINEREKYWEEENLNAQERANEIILTRLRTKWGIDLENLKNFKLDMRDFYKQVESFKEKNWLEVNNQTVSLTQKGKNFADYIAGELFFE